MERPRLAWTSSRQQFGTLALPELEHDAAQEAKPQVPMRPRRERIDVSGLAETLFPKHDATNKPAEARTIKRNKLGELGRF